MCGRFALIDDPALIADYFAVEDVEPFPPRYNIAPTQPVLIIRPKAKVTGGDNAPNREVLLVRWGLLPTWLKDPKGFPLLINARSETAAAKPSFKAAMRHRRILFAASGFYEWKRHDGKALQAFWVTNQTGGPIAFAGVMETWTGPDGEEIDTAAILTTASKGAVADVHDRMPVAIEPENFSRWLDCKNSEPRDVADLYGAMGDDFYKPIPVSDAVNKVANSSPELLSQVPLKAAEPKPVKPKDDNPQLSLL